MCCNVLYIIRCGSLLIAAGWNRLESLCFRDSCKLWKDWGALTRVNKLLIFIAWLSLLCPLAAEEIRVAAAADLDYAMNDLAASFEQKTGNKVAVSFGASGNFYSEIQSGAPFDLFFSADAEYPKKLAAAGKIDNASLRTYAIGRLVLWVPNSSKLDPQKMKMDLLLDPSVKKIAIANPEHAPYGRAAVAALDHYIIKGLVSDKLVMGENVSQAAQFVDSGNAQAGLIALSLAISPTMKDKGKYWELPQEAYPEIQQSAGIVSSSKRKAVAQEFLDYVTSPQGAAVLERYGFPAPSRP
jgi:molybdate transport system substrate-binding protein